MNFDKYLPIGTVCRLKNAEKSLMIIGFSQSDASNREKVYDYAGCMYPEGVISSDMNFLFNHDQIETIIYKGFINEEEVVFKKRLNEFLTNGTIDGQNVTFNQDGTLEFEGDNNVESSISVGEQSNIKIETNNEVQANKSNMFNTLNLNQQNDVNNS